MRSEQDALPPKIFRPIGAIQTCIRRTSVVLIMIIFTLLCYDHLKGSASGNDLFEFCFFAVVWLSASSLFLSACVCVAGYFSGMFK